MPSVARSTIKGSIARFIADAVTLPGLAFLGELMPEIDIEGLWAAQQRVRTVLSDQLADRWSAVYDLNRASGTVPLHARRRRPASPAQHRAAVPVD